MDQGEVVCNFDGWIRTLLEEADKQGMHLMTFVAIAKPSWFERIVMLMVQALFLTRLNAPQCNSHIQALSVKKDETIQISSAVALRSASP